MMNCGADAEGGPFAAGGPSPGTPPKLSASWSHLTRRLAWRALLRPMLALDLWRTCWCFRRRGWYRRAPFLPIPPRSYIRWRMDTAYGEASAVPPLEDVVRFARWRRLLLRQ
jgi:hypothetical protein